MATRRGKSQARRHGSSGLPGWAWLVIGVLATLLLVLAAPRLLKSDGSGDGFLRIGPRPNPDALPATPHAGGEAIAPDIAGEGPAPAPRRADPAAKPTQYDFYTLLPGEEVAVSDAELAASARAESEAQARAARQAATTGGTALPAPIAEGAAGAAPAPSADPATTAGAPSAATAAEAAASAPAPASDARYVLQAGAFGASGDAEAVKAKIALLGLNARVESAEIGGKTVYRVRMGPYGTASDLAEAKAKLTSGGLPAMAVKTN